MSTVGSCLREGDRVMSAAELERAAIDLAQALRDDRRTGYVAIAAVSSAAQVAAVIGATRVGRAVAPLSDRPLRPDSLEAAALERRLDDLRPEMVLADEAHEAVLTDAGFRPGEPVGSLGLRRWSAREPGPPADPRAALVVYTSGSSGQPKGAVLTAATLRFILAGNARLYRWRADDRLLSCLPLTHLAGLTNTLSALQAGVDIIVPPSFSFVDAVVDTIQSNEVTVAGVVPYQLGRLFCTDRVDDLSGLRLVVCSAAPLTAAVIDRVRAHRPHLDVVNAYGLTEAFRSCTRRVGDGRNADSIGRPMAGVETRVVEPDTGADADLGQQGELWLRGPNTFAGYVHRPTTDPARHGDWVRTGDLVVADETGFRLRGRRRHVVNVAGEKTPIEVIEAIVDQVAPGAIAAHPVRHDDGNDRVVVVVERSARVSLAEVRRFSARRLSASLRPREVVVVDALPRLRNGKVDRRAVADLVGRAEVERCLAGSS